LRFDLWSLFMQEARFTENLQKSDGKWLSFFKEWQKWTVGRLGNDYIYRWRSSVPVSAWNLQKWPHLGQKKVISGTHLKVQLCSKNHGLGHNGSFRCVRATCVASKPNERAMYNQENILSLFLPDGKNKTSDTGKVTERRFMKTCWIWHCFWMEHQLTRPQKL
jgi:hypothetical protein